MALLVSSLVQRALAEGPPAFPGWSPGSDSQHHFERLLYYVPRWLGRDDSIVDSQDFFLSPQGSYDSLAEAAATWSAFFEPVQEGQEDRHAQCRFPARFRLFDESLGISRLDALPRPKCRAFVASQQAFDAQSVSLVFSDFFVSSPVSAFGHVFLRFGKERSHNPLLDVSVSYAAATAGMNPWVTTLTGPFGGVKGWFYFMPYYLKVQEYNNFEGRDLWEYELTLTPSDVDWLVRSAWEIAPTSIDYFYFDENCALVLLTLLDTAQPQRALASRFMGAVTPTDVVRLIWHEPGLVKRADHRPSSLSRYQSRVRVLDGDDGARMRALTETRDPRALDQLAVLPLSSQVRILDALLEWIDHDLRLAAATVPQDPQVRAYRDAALARRASLRQVSEPVNYDVPKPHMGHGTSRSGLYGFAESSSGQGQLVTGFGLTARGALHDLSSPAGGYPPRATIEFFDLDASVIPERSQVRLERFTLMRVASVPAYDPLLVPLSWNLEVGLNRTPCQLAAYNATDRCLETRLEGGAGVSWGWQNALTAYAFPSQLRLGVRSDGIPMGGWTPRLGLAWEPHRLLRVHLSAAYLLLWSTEQRGPLAGQNYRVEQALAWTRNLEWRMGADVDRRPAGLALRATAGLMIYF